MAAGSAHSPGYSRVLCDRTLLEETGYTPALPEDHREETGPPKRKRKPSDNNEGYNYIVLRGCDAGCISKQASSALVL